MINDWETWWDARRPDQRQLLLEHRDDDLPPADVVALLGRTGQSMVAASSDGFRSGLTFHWPPGLQEFLAGQPGPQV